MLAALRGAFTSQPLLTNILGSGVISAGGDAIAQFGIERRSLAEYDLKRTGRFFVLASCFIAPCLHRWLGFLERRIQPGRLKPVKAVLIDQLTFSPGFNAVVLVVLRVLEGYTPLQAVDKCRQDWWNIWSNSLKVWPAAQLVNFYFVPPALRVIFIQCVALFWNSFLSLQTQTRVDKRPTKATLQQLED